MVQLLAPRARVNPVGAEPYLEMLPSALVAAAVPVPEVVPPALCTTSEIELSSVPVTVSVPEAVAAKLFEVHTASAKSAANTTFVVIFIVVDFSLFSSVRLGTMGEGHLYCHVLLSGFRDDV